MVSEYDHEFWTTDSPYHDLAQNYEQGIERTHPSSVTSKGMCVCLNWCHWCGWAATKVDYYEYRGGAV